MAVFSFSGRPPRASLEALRARLPGGRFSFDWRDVWQDEHIHSFVVAKMMNAELLRDVHAALEQAISEGWTRDQFIETLRPSLVEAGWWGRQSMTDPVTGQTSEVQLGSNRRLKTIYDVNLRQSHAAGRWQRIQETKDALPWLIYTAVLDNRTRDEHAAWGGRDSVRIVLPVDHPFWATHYPPNGWGCRCTVIQASDAMLAAWGLTPSTDADLEAAGFGQTRAWVNGRTGEVEQVPLNIDPGFAHNPGMARRAALAPPPIPEPQRISVVGERWPRALPPAPDARPFPPGTARRPELEGEAVFDAFARVLGVSEGGVYFDKAQMPLVIERGLFQTRTASGMVVGSKAAKHGRAEWAELLASAIADPDEIWVATQRYPDGTTRLTRSYVAVFDDPDGQRFWFTAVFTERGGWWHGVTAFPPAGAGRRRAQERYASTNARAGVLVYRRSQGGA